MATKTEAVKAAIESLANDAPTPPPSARQKRLQEQHLRTGGHYFYKAREDDAHYTCECGKISAQAWKVS